MSPQTLNLIFIVGMFAVFWFFIIRPQQQQAKKRQAMLDALKEGDEVITIGGIHGTVKTLREKEAVLKVAPGVEFTVNRSAVGSVKKADNQ